MPNHMSDDVLWVYLGDAARELEVSPPTLDRMIRMSEEEEFG